MNLQTSCTNCGTTIPANAPVGICPKCAFGLAMGGAPQEQSMASTAMGTSFVAPRPEDLQPRFENLEIIELLGHGGMGAVYKARQKNLDRIVALKILSPGISNDPTFAQRFTREARTLAKLSHPNIVTVFEFGTIDNLHYLLMEFVDGVDLRTAMREGSLQTDGALPVVQQVCAALQYAHDQGIVHRDIKPENILLGQQGTVKIADFGLAKLVQSESYEHSLTGTQQVVGTRNYMAPEQIETPTRVDHRADIYSLGVVFYELLTGELPLGRFAAPSEKAYVNTRLDDVVMRALEKEPDKRFQQASHVQTAVESIEGQPYSSRKHQPQKPPVVKRPGKVPPLPFSIPKLYHGLAVALGLAHFDGSVIELEFEVRDDVLGAMKSKPQRITIPVSELVEVDYKTGAFSGRITLKADRLEAVTDVPNNRHGQFTLQVKKEHRGQAEDFANAVAMAIHSGPGPGDHLRNPIPTQRESPLKGGKQTSPVLVEGQVDADEAAQFIRGPAFGLLAVGVINALVALGLWISFMVGTMSWVGSLAENPSDDSSTTSSSVSVIESPVAPESPVAAESPEAPSLATTVESASASAEESSSKGDFFLVRWIKNLVNQFADFSFGKLIVSTLMAVLLIFAAIRMLHLNDYEFCVFAAVLAVIPIQSASVLGIGFGIWALVMLNKPGVKAAFSPSIQPALAGLGFPVKGETHQNPLTEAIRAPAIVVLHLSKTVFVIGICLLFSFGLIFLINLIVSFDSDGGIIRPEFGDSVSAISDRIDEYEDQFEERIDDYESTDDVPGASAVADMISRELEAEYAVIQSELNELKATAETNAEFRKLNSRASRLSRYRKALEMRMLEIKASDASDD